MRKKYGKIYLLPSLFTITNVFFGFLSVIFSIHGRYSLAALWIILAAVMDALDGIIARATNSQSDFGTQLDSLADAFSFGAAPSILLYLWGTRIAGPPGVFFSFIFLTGAILRLARFNIISKTHPDRKHYLGLPVPSASAFICSLVIFHPQPLESHSQAFLLILLIVVIALLMVSRIKYRNFLNINFRKRTDLKAALLLAVLVSSLIFYTRIFILSFSSLFILSGPAGLTIQTLKKKKREKSREEPALS